MLANSRPGRGEILSKGAECCKSAPLPFCRWNRFARAGYDRVFLICPTFSFHKFVCAGGRRVAAPFGPPYRTAKIRGSAWQDGSGNLPMWRNVPPGVSCLRPTCLSRSFYRLLNGGPLDATSSLPARKQKAPVRKFVIPYTGARAIQNFPSLCIKTDNPKFTKIQL